MRLAEGLPLTVFDSVYHVGPLLGQGSEGSVYAICDSDDTARFALKWYHLDKAFPGRHASLMTLTDQGAPSDLFLWPLAVIASDDGSQFGYVMDLRPPDYVGMAKLLSGQVERSERGISRGALDLAEALYALHIKGLCFNDLSFGNVFVRPADGSVRLCDNDNVRVEGDRTAFVDGTPKFMAPEVVRGEAKASAATDRFSLAVLLFYLFMVGHPLEGRKTEVVLSDDAANHRFHGTEPVFCFDPSDPSNRPDEEYHSHVGQLWESLPGFIQELFVRSFTDGLHDPDHRVRDSEWVASLRRLLDCATVCSNCDEERFLDLSSAASACPWCSFVPREQLVLAVESHPDVSVAAVRGAELREYHFSSRFGSGTPVARILNNAESGNGLLLENLSAVGWHVRDTDSSMVSVPPGSRISIGAGLEIVSLQSPVSVKNLPLLG